MISWPTSVSISLVDESRLWVLVAVALLEIVVVGCETACFCVGGRMEVGA